MPGAPASMPCVTLTTDFGTADTWVGQTKGALIAIAPAVRIVDLCHDVPAHDIRAGAYLLEIGSAVFPEGTIHVAVVDPGVGTVRRRVAVETRRYRFVGPDNGVLSRALRQEAIVRAHEIVDPRFLGASRSATFEGRDVFAPAAGWLARGVSLADLGPAVEGLVQLAPPLAAFHRGRPQKVPVVHVDRFGNVTLDVRAVDAATVTGAPIGPASSVRVDTPAGEVSRVARTFADAPPGEPVLLVNAAGYLELALERGRADLRLGLRPGDSVTLTFG